MSRFNSEQMRQALVEFGNDWILNYWGSQAPEILRQLADRLERFADRYRTLYHETVDPFDLIASNPTKAAAFFQLDTLRLSDDMKVAVWRILVGCEIAALRFEYKLNAAPKLKIELRASVENRLEEFESDDPDDFRLLRHLSATTSAGSLALEGYYASKSAAP